MFIIFGLKSMIKQLLNLVYRFLHLKCIIKQLLDSVFVICKIINVSVRVIITLTSTLIIKNYWMRLSRISELSRQRSALSAEAEG